MPLLLQALLYWILVQLVFNFNWLTHWSRDKMAAVFQMAFSNAFYEIYKFQLRFHWNLFPRVQLATFHWFRWWLGAIQVTNHYLNQWWLVYWWIYESLGLNELKQSTHIVLHILTQYSYTLPSSSGGGEKNSYWVVNSLRMTHPAHFLYCSQSSEELVIYGPGNGTQCCHSDQGNVTITPAAGDKETISHIISCHQSQGFTHWGWNKNGQHLSENVFKLIFLLLRLFYFDSCFTQICSNKGYPLTHWGRTMHISVSKLTIIGSDNGLAPGQRNDGILWIGCLGTNFGEISIGIQTFSFKKMHLTMSFAKWHPFCLSLNVLKCLSHVYCSWLWL